MKGGGHRASFGGPTRGLPATRRLQDPLPAIETFKTRRKLQEVLTGRPVK